MTILVMILMRPLSIMSIQKLIVLVFAISSTPFSRLLLLQLLFHYFLFSCSERLLCPLFLEFLPVDDIVQQTVLIYADDILQRKTALGLQLICLRDNLPVLNESKLDA